MPNITVKIVGMDTFDKALRKAPEFMVNEMSKAIQSSLNTVRSAAIKESPVGKGDGSGNLRRSIQPPKMETALRGYVEANAPYAAAVHDGSEPHDIYPKNAKALAFEVGGSRGYVTSKSGSKYYKSTSGEMVIVRHVRHPGYRGNPFFVRALDQSFGTINAFFNRAIINVLNTIK